MDAVCNIAVSLILIIMCVWSVWEAFRIPNDTRKRQEFIKKLMDKMRGDTSV